MKQKVGIIVGQDSDLPESLIKKFEITTFPFVIDWNSYDKKSNIYSLMRKTVKGGPKTSQPAPSVFKKLFDDKLRSFEQLIVITVSSKFSGTFNSALQARKLINRANRIKIHIIDSESSSGAEGLLVLEAARLINDKRKIEDITSEIKKYVSNTKLIGVFEDPKWLVAGGRISKIKGILVKNMLKGGFRPVLTIKDGEIVVKKIHANAKDSAQALFSQFKAEIDGKSNLSVVITHADNEKGAKKLKSLIEKSTRLAKIEYIHEISPVVGAHLGPDTLLLSWVQK